MTKLSSLFSTSSAVIDRRYSSDRQFRTTSCAKPGRPRFGALHNKSTLHCSGGLSLGAARCRACASPTADDAELSLYCQRFADRRYSAESPLFFTAIVLLDTFQAN